MGRPPAGPGGMKVEDLPRVTIRLEPEILERARAHGRETRQPLWRLIQELLRAHLDQTPTENSRPSNDPTPPPTPTAVSITAPAETLPHALPLTRQEVEALQAALHWRTSGKLLEDGEHQAVTDLYERACTQSELLFRIGLDKARRRPRGATSAPWELTLEDCRRLRRITRQFLAAGKERAEAQISLFFYGKDPIPVLEQAKHHKRIRKEMRTANGKLRAVLKKIPWR